MSRSRANVDQHHPPLRQPEFAGPSNKQMQHDDCRGRRGSAQLTCWTTARPALFERNGPRLVDVPRCWKAGHRALTNVFHRQRASHCVGGRTRRENERQFCLFRQRNRRERTLLYLFALVGMDGATVGGPYPGPSAAVRSRWDDGRFRAPRTLISFPRPGERQSFGSGWRVLSNAHTPTCGVDLNGDYRQDFLIDGHGPAPSSPHRTKEKNGNIALKWAVNRPDLSNPAHEQSGLFRIESAAPGTPEVTGRDSYFGTNRWSAPTGRTRLPRQHRRLGPSFPHGQGGTGQNTPVTH